MKIVSDQLLTSSEVGDLLQVNPSSVKKWVDDGLLLALGTDVLALPAASVEACGPQEARVSACVRVAAPRPWTEAAPVALVLAKRVTPDLPSHPAFVSLSTPSPLYLSVRP